MLNKRTGWESRTVPPLYVLKDPSFGENRSLGQPGKAEGVRRKSLQGMSQKTCEMGPSAHRGFTVCFVAEKRLRRLCDAAANLISGGKT